jgi:FtsH-binding integral membrane protein
MENKSVFLRTQADSTGAEISRNVYNLIIGLTLGWGFFVNYCMIQAIPADVIVGINPWVFFIGYFASCFLGVYLFQTSSNPAVSFIGYNLVVVPLGFIVDIVVAQYQPALVLEAIQMTGAVTLLMMVLGTLFPAFFKRIAGALTIALLCVIVVELIATFFLHKQYGIIDWIVVVIFCGYIGYDWGRANSIPPTIDNAIDSAASLYLDIINLFLRILRILGRRD